MNYFLELLESYSKLKKRKLNLLEAGESQAEGPSPEAVAAAKNAIATFQNTPSTDPKDKNKRSFPSKTEYLKNSGKYKVRIFNQGEGNPDKYQFNTSPFSIDVLPQENTPGWNKFVSYFDKNRGVASPKEETDQPTGEQGVGGQPVADIDSKAKSFISTVLEDPLEQLEAADNVSKAKKSWGSVASFLASMFGIKDGVIKIGNVTKSVKDLLNTFLGSTHQSLEKKLAITKKTLVEETDESGRTVYRVVGEKPIDSKHLLNYTRSIQKFFSIFDPTSDRTTLKERLIQNASFISNLFAINSDGTVTIYPTEGSTDGFVLDDNNEIVQELLRKIEDHTDGELEIRRVDIHKKVNTSLANYVRGTILEHFMGIAFYSTQIASLAGKADSESEQKRKAFESLLKEYKQGESGERFRKNIKVLKQLHENWKKGLLDATLSEEEHASFRALSELIGEGSERDAIFKVAFGMNRHVLSRNPIAMVHSGERTGPGKKADMIELYDESNPNRPSRAVKVTVTSKDKAYAKYIKMGILREGQTVYAYAPSFKHYLPSKEKGGADFSGGSTSKASARDLAKGVKQVGKSGQTRDDVIRQNRKDLVGNKTAAPQRLAKLAEDLDKIEASFDKLNIKSIDPTTNAKRNSIETLVDTILDKVRSQSSYSDKFSDSDQKRALVLCEIYKRAKSESSKQEAAQAIKDFMTSTATSLKVASLLSSKDPEEVNDAKNLIITNINSAGLATDDGHGSIHRVLGDEATTEYDFSQNEVLDIFKKAVSNYPNSFTAGTNQKFKMEKAPNGRDIIFKDKNGNQVGSLEYDNTKQGYTVRYNEHMLSLLGDAVKKTEIPYRIGADPRTEQTVTIQSNNKLIEMFIETQKKILQTLVDLQKESVVK